MIQMNDFLVIILMDVVATPTPKHWFFVNSRNVANIPSKVAYWALEGYSYASSRLSKAALSWPNRWHIGRISIIFIW